jgi:16S rRNA C1402 (ribose-2'-O) methylase RsmI
MARTSVFLIASPIGDYMQDMSVSAIHALKTVTHVFLEADDGFTERLREQGVLGDRHRLYFLDQPQVDRARELIGARQPFAILASSGIPCFLDPGREIVRLCLDQHLDDVELVPLGLSSALDAALCMGGLDLDVFRFNGHYPEHYAMDGAAIAERVPLVYFVRGPAIREFVAEVSDEIPHVHRLILLKDIRKKRRARVVVLREANADHPDVPEPEDDADYACVIDRTLVE